jgi:hypothetical protein
VTRRLLLAHTAVVLMKLSWGNAYSFSHSGWRLCRQLPGCCRPYVDDGYIVGSSDWLIDHIGRYF